MILINMINTFKAINIPEDKKPIVICDIDLTFIRPIYDYNDVYHRLKSHFSDPIELDIAVNFQLKRDVNIYINLGLVKQTDKDGFLQMLDKINQIGGKFLFLTARSSFHHEKTIRDLQNAGLQNPEEFEIHYTGNQITKGDYIQKHALLNGYDHHIFIDDYPSFLESALKNYPDMNCYLFKYDK